MINGIGEFHLILSCAKPFQLIFRSFDLLVEPDDTAKVVLLLHNNTIETHTFSTTEKKPESQRSSIVNIPSHRSDVRTLCFSSDNTTVLSGSGDSVKIWNR